MKQTRETTRFWFILWVKLNWFYCDNPNVCLFNCKNHCSRKLFLFFVILSFINKEKSTRVHFTLKFKYLHEKLPITVVRRLYQCINVKIVLKVGKSLWMTLIISYDMPKRHVIYVYVTVSTWHGWNYEVEHSNYIKIQKIIHKYVSVFWNW